jgi:hypothetical protein
MLDAKEHLPRQHSDDDVVAFENLRQPRLEIRHGTHSRSTSTAVEGLAGREHTSSPGISFREIDIQILRYIS